MTTLPQKKIRTVKRAAPAAVSLPAFPEADRHLVGDLPGDERVEYYYEERVANWLGVPRKRISVVRRRAMHEGRDWVVRDWQVVFTHAGIERLRSHLRDLTLYPNTETAAEESVAEEPLPQPGPLERKKLRVVRVFPNPRLLWATGADDAVTAGAAGVVVRVKENTNFMAGMTFEAVHHPRSGWQFVGRLPRSKGKW